ncbi:MtnX-like HAD-IB family phosphatase [Desulfoscipio gibsoniae]|uniref:Haloacid dehalogenase superfamily protein, phosphoserine phosphatase/2,3-diketo-5-methylthio-1-phosphopentane phosphatase n=1 Tax=Desulfoscipio gibsoniae DSM 7213 TaxID=767817 RepID=R4K9D6_9FIRM|nr:MtnX-like HAD-IB family phosphatase [Desulfoscipio gibsoniae]AGK99782.1 haloacid dehalogenase superfamily protein, phosphoserine phosphatase/2,3-diketo-5-methylthio-1-phosphopentane phosphatase [Desulfoscipio gibsoniae DSM 7213]
MKKVFYIDFDGTITQKDTCQAMVEAFAGEGWQQINELWEKRKISTEECANRTFQLFRATLDDLRSLLDTIEIDEGFGTFVKFCKKECYPVYILSDGYDFCIEYILKKHGYKIPYFANQLVFEQGFRIRCSYYNQDCGLCGTCKLSLMKRLTQPGSQVVYVGDGISDICPAGHSNLVFAKGKLFEYCRAEGISAIPIAGFIEVLEKLS